MKISLDVINRRLEHTISMMNLTHNHTNYPKCQKGGKKHIGKRLQEREEQDGKKKKKSQSFPDTLKSILLQG